MNSLSVGQVLKATLDLRLDVLAEIYPMARETGRALYKVRSSLDGLTYALKVFDLGLNETAAIKREMVALNRQLHIPEKFPRYRYFFERQGKGFLLLDWMDGTPLTEIGKSGAAKNSDDVRHRVVCLREICAALKLVHKTGHCHRDIKPPNILLRDPRNPLRGVILIDFGLAAMKRGGMEGTTGFAAPEQMGQRDAAIDRRTDVFGVGAVAWWLMTGETFGYYSDSEGGWSGLAPGALCAKVPSVDEHLERVILKALSYRPADRHNSAQELEAQLRGIER